MLITAGLVVVGLVVAVLLFSAAFGDKLARDMEEDRNAKYYGDE